MKVDRWLEIRVRGAGLDPGVLVEALLEVGGRAVHEEKGWQVTHVPDPGDPTGVRERTDALRHALGGAEAVEVETRWQRQEDWDAFWKRGLDARRLTPGLVVTPSWIQPEAGPTDVVIILDPGMAFGNAEHGTTRGCLRLLEGVVEVGSRLLDVGAGSGILSIAAARFGAREVLALEADPLAIPAAQENVERNGVADRVRLREERVTVDGLRRREPFHGVMANLESGLLRPLLPGLVHAVRPGGWLLLSGILDHEWTSIRDRTEELGTTLDAVDPDGEWRSGLFRRRPSG